MKQKASRLMRKVRDIVNEIRLILPETKPVLADLGFFLCSAVPLPCDENKNLAARKRRNPEKMLLTEHVTFAGIPVMHRKRFFALE